MMAPPPPFFRVARPSRGVRRRRDDDFEIEALDTQTMRQKSYNYFQQQQQQQQQRQAHPSTSSSGLPTFQSSLRHSPSSRKRQRTLAEQMEGLTLSKGAGGTPSGRASARFVELDELGRERSARDPDDSGEDDEASDGDQGEMLVYGGVPSAMRRFFDAPRGDHRPLDFFYRHYISLATKHHRDATDSNGKEIVVFRRSPASLSPVSEAQAAAPGEMTLPRYLSITPQDFQRLSTEEKRQWYQMHLQYLGQQHQDQEPENKREEDMNADEKFEWLDDADKHEAKSTPLPSLPSFAYRHHRRSSSASSSESFRAIGVPATDEDGAFSVPGGDVEMVEDGGSAGYMPRVPHPAGAITHMEWFDDDDDDL